MSKELTLVELTALSKLVEKKLKAHKELNGKLEPGNYAYDFEVRVDGSLGRAKDGEATPPFYIANFLKAVILRYAQTLDDPAEWLERLMEVDGALGAVIQLGPDTVLKSVDAELLAIWDACEKQAKKKYQDVTPKKPRAGNTSVVGSIERTVRHNVPQLDE